MGQYYGGLGPMTNAVLWAEVAIFAIFVGLRLYTRISILNAAGADDYLIIVALVGATPDHSITTGMRRLTWFYRFFKFFTQSSSPWRRPTGWGDCSLTWATPKSIGPPSNMKSSAK